MLSIQQMHYLVVLSETRNFVRASELCHVTQPTLSMQVKKAEQLLGHVVFDRDRNPVELTLFGQELIPVLRDILNEEQRLSTITAKWNGTYKEEIRMGVIPTVASYLIPELFTKWKAHLPGVQLIIEEMRTPDLLVAMMNKQVDLAILAGPVSDPSFRTIPLYQEEIMAYTKEIETSEVDIAQLTDLHPWLLTKGNCLRTQMVSFNQRDFLKHIRSGAGKNYPAREIIALAGHRTTKWGSIERMIREVQLSFRARSNKQLEVLSWNG
ncbi:MAG: LysR substrate-binding domain-containing protein [Cryomorphaceae bacterium]|nr:LysR substrate-binding domain-containing protein [Cryomorphaceae bacterium]